MTAGIKANADGSAAIQVGGSDAITITSGLDTTFAGTASVATGALYPLVSGTAVASTSGTSVTFTGIPSTAKRITVMFSGVSTSGASNLQIQIGSTTFTTTGYTTGHAYISGTASASGTITTGIGSLITVSAATTYVASFVLLNITGNAWICAGTYSAVNANYGGTTQGSITLGGALDRVRITTVNGTDTFDAGSINILWE
jgi:hypothetical protein